MGAIRIRVCGEVRVEPTSADEAIGGGLARELLALLVVQRGDEMSTDEVVDALWPVAAPPTAPTIVHGAVARLRRALGRDAVVRSDAGYLLDPSVVSCDLWDAWDLQGDGRIAEADALLVQPVLGRYAERDWARDAVATGGADAPPAGWLAHGSASAGALAVGHRRVAAVPAVARLVGRRRELVTLGDLRRRSRLVTVVGLGGVGKTRLVTEVLANTQERVLRVDLGRGSGSFGSRVAGAAGVVLGNGRLGGLVGLAGLFRDVDIFVVDGCELDLDGAADGIAFLLDRWPHLSVIATSRSALGVAGEHVQPLLPFSDPGDSRGDAVELLLDRMRGLGLPLGSGDRERAAEVCARCAGVPLAIELAAADLVGDRTPNDLGARPQLVVRARIEEALARLTPHGEGLARTMVLLAGGLTPAVADHLRPREGSALVRELLTAGMLTAEATALGRRFYLPDSLRSLLSRSTTEQDTRAAAAALTALGSPSSLPGGELAEAAALAPAIAELENVAGMLDHLTDAGAHDARLDMAMAFRMAWFEHGAWAFGEAEILNALAALETQRPIDPVARAEAISGAIEVAGSFEACARLLPLAERSAADAEAAGRLDLVVLLRYAQACGHGYLGNLSVAAGLVADVRTAATRSGSEALLLRAEGLEALAQMLVGRPGVARSRLVALAERCRTLGWAGAAARIRLMASQAGRAAGDIDGALLDVRVAEELATVGLARASLAWIRAEAVELELERAGGAGGVATPESLRPAVEAALEVAVPAGQFRITGLCHLRLALLDHDRRGLAQAALELLDVDGRAAALALTHILDYVPPDDPLRALIPRAVVQLSASGTPLAASDTARVEACADRSGPPPGGWREVLSDSLLALASWADLG